MRKNFKIFLAFALALFIVPSFGQTAFADVKVYDDIEDGEYEITAKALHETKDEESTMATYLDEKASLIVEDGKVKLTLTINNQQYVTGLQVEGKNSVEKEVSADKETRNETFNVNKLTELIDAQVQYEVPGVMTGDHKLRLSLKGLDKLPVVEEEPEEVEEDPVAEEDKSDDATEENEDESDKKDESDKGSTKSLKDLNDGTYTVDVSYLRTDNDKVSSMGNYLGNLAFVTIKNGKAELMITVNDVDAVTKLLVNGVKPSVTKSNGDKRYETFAFNALNPIANAYVEYQAPFGDSIHKGNAEFRIVLDENNVKKVNESDNPGKVEDPKEDPKKDPKPNPKPENPKKDTKPKKDPKKEQKANLTPDKVSKIDYVIKHEDGVQDSVANDFFTGKATLLEKDGKTYVQMTINNGDMVRDLRNKYGKALIVKTNSDGSIVVQLRVDNDLSNMLLNMRIVVPAMPGFPGYDSKHDALLVFDKQSKKEIAVGENKLVGTNDKKNGNGPTIKAGEGPVAGTIDENGGNGGSGGNTGNGGDNGTTPGKPAFGDGKTDGKDDNGAKSGKGKNPQTGDTTNIILFAMLLIGSAIPLVVQARRRFN